MGHVLRQAIIKMFARRSLLMHLFCKRHASLFLQLQLAVLMTCDWLFLIMSVLVFSDYGLNVIHATVANLDCVSVETSM